MFNWNDFINGAADLFKDDPWNISVEEFVKTKTQDIFIHPTSVVEQGAVLKGPIFIGPNCFVGAHAYLRGGVYLMGNNSIGPGCELKSCILFPNSNLAHFNFIGDSIIGSNVNLEAGSIIANHYNERNNKEIFPGVTKFGAIVGDGCKIGANAVLSPGTILKKETIVGRSQLIKQHSMSEERTGFQWRDLLANKTFDLFIVILGVTIAFQLNNWKISNDQKATERFYKEGLLADINDDIAEITSIMEELHADREKLESYLPVMDKYPADSLLTPILAIMSLETFSENDNTYKTLVASTGLNTFSDRELVQKLTEYYGSYTPIRRFEDIYTDVIFEINRFLAKSLIYDQRKVVDKAVITAPQTRNLLIVADGQLNTGLEDYQEALENARALKDALEKSL